MIDSGAWLSAMPQNFHLQNIMMVLMIHESRGFPTGVQILMGCLWASLPLSHIVYDRAMFKIYTSQTVVDVIVGVNVFNCIFPGGSAEPHKHLFWPFQCPDYSSSSFLIGQTPFDKTIYSIWHFDFYNNCSEAFDHKST